MRSKKALYNIGTSLILQFVTIVYGFIVPKIIISSFGSNVNGLVSSITQFLAYIILLESGFGPVVKSVLYKPIANKDKKTIESILKTTEKFFRRIAYLFIIYIIILCLFYPLLVENEFSWIFTASLILIIGISTFAEYFFGMTYRLYLQANQKTYIISIIQIVTYILSLLSIIIMAKLGSNIQLLKLVSGMIFIFRPLIQNYYVKKKYNVDLCKVSSEYNLKQKWDGLAQHIAAVIHGNADITILTIFSSLAEVSVYSVYYLVVKGIKSLIQSFTSGVDASFGDMLAKKEYKNLNEKFNIYEIIYLSIVAILFTSTLLLITPFISIYTSGIKDVNYIRYTFGYLLVISEYIWAIRLPYNAIVLAAGHFKETKKGAIFEATINIIISILLVGKYGIVGVTIGTIIAMTIRTIEFIYHANKYILNRSMFATLNKILLLIIESLIIVVILNIINLQECSTYISWGINALITCCISTLVVFTLNLIFNKKQIVQVYSFMKSIFKKRV